jgi:hypothetical protein
MEDVRYQPGEAVRWLQIGAADRRKQAQRQGQSVWRREGERSLGKDLKQIAGVLTELGRSALADVAHRQALAAEYVLHDKEFESVENGRVKTVRYDSILSIKVRGDKASLIFEQGSLVIHPHAYVVAGRTKVPVGWQRNGMEVPYELLIDELSARCGRPVEYEG